MVNGKLPKYWGSVLVAILAFAFVAIAQNTNILSVRPTASDSAVGEVRLHEKRANGNNYVGLKSPVSLAADSVFEMPGADGSSGDCLTTNGSKVLAFSPCAGSVSWDLLPPTDNDKSIGSRTSRVSSLVMGDAGIIEMYDGTYQRVQIKPPGAGSAFVLRDSGGNDIFRVSGSGSTLIKGGTLSGNFSFGNDDTYTFGEYNYRPNTIFSRNFQVSDAVNTRVFLGTAIGQVDTGSAIYAKNAAGTDVFRVTYGGTTTVNNLTVSGACTGCGSGGYNQVREENVNVAQTQVLNFVGSAITAADSGGTRTDVTLSQSPSGSTSVVGTGRTISTSSPLSGGGALTGDLTLSCPTCVATNASNTFTATQTISGAQLNFNDALATKIQFYTGFTASVASGALRFARAFNSDRISFGYGNYTEDIWISNGALNLGNNRLYASATILTNKSLGPETGNTYDLGDVTNGIGWRDLQLDRHAYIEGNIENTGTYAKITGQLRLSTTADTSWTPSGNTTAKIAIYNTSGTFLGWVPIYP